VIEILQDVARCQNVAGGRRFAQIRQLALEFAIEPEVVGIHERDPVAAGCIDTGVARHCAAAVGRVHDESYARIDCGEVDLLRSVG